MNKRQFLSRAVASLFALLLLGFCWILFSGINLTEESDVASDSVTTQHKIFKGLTNGQIVLRHYRGRAVWVLSLSQQQQGHANELNAYVLEGGVACDVSSSFCVLSAATERAGINTHYTLQAPPQLNVDVPWYGGFVDPTNGVMYDFLGRLYKGQKQQNSMLSIKVK